MLALALASVGSAATRTANVPAAAAPAGFDLSRDEIATFIDGVASRNSLRRNEVKALLAKAVPQPKIIELITRPAEKVAPWWQYRERFLTEQRIREGTQFYLAHRERLQKVSAEHGIPAEYLVAIVGVETFYGRITGGYRVLDALSTLAFDYPPRSAFFRSELEQFMLLTREESIDPLKTVGSYAGAMGGPQFMPSSYRRYAVDGDGDSKRDLWTNWDDVVASVANYFHEHGWEPGAPVVVPAKLDPDPTFQIDPRNLDLNHTLDSLNAVGVRTELQLPGSTPVLLVSAEEREGPAYRVGFKNFHVITRYNRSARYAMAVHDLAQAIAERVRDQAS